MNHWYFLNITNKLNELSEIFVYTAFHDQMSFQHRQDGSPNVKNRRRADPTNIFTSERHFAVCICNCQFHVVLDRRRYKKAKVRSVIFARCRRIKKNRQVFDYPISRRKVLMGLLLDHGFFQPTYVHMWNQRNWKAFFASFRNIFIYVHIKICLAS
jgi:hypothetical protein